MATQLSDTTHERAGEGSTRISRAIFSIFKIASCNVIKILGDDSAYFVIKMHAELNVELGNSPRTRGDCRIPAKAHTV